jgi:Uri superfamily endonuclease
MAFDCMAAAKESTSYQLTLEVRRRIRVEVGSLGTFDFPAGRYAYTGSA